MKIDRSVFVKAVAIAGVALGALGTASVAQARSDLFFSIGANIAPGVTLGASNARPYYQQPVYLQPAPVYYQPAPIYYQPAPVYYEPAPVYYQPAPVHYPSTYVTQPVYGVTYVRPARHHRHHDQHHGRHFYRY